MKGFVKVISIAVSSIALIACGGGGGSDESTESEGPVQTALEAPSITEVQVESTASSISWVHPSPSAVSDYRVYSAVEAITDQENYSVFDGAQLSMNSTSPFLLETSRQAEIYHIYVTAIADEMESEFSGRALSVPRYQVVNEGEWVRDLVTNLEWRRCFIGMEYDAEVESCVGSPTRLYFDEAQNAANAMGARVPGVWEMLGLNFCDTGSRAWFAGNQNPGSVENANCASTDPKDDPELNLEVAGHYPAVFPSVPTDAGYWTRTFCDDLTGDNRDRYLINFGDSVTCGSPSSALWLYLRPVRDI